MDELHVTPPHEFVARRDAVARELAAAGDPGAAAVGRLPRPTLPVWSINLAARRDSPAVEALAAAGEEVLKAHGRVLGGASGEELLRANRALGAALEAAVASAARLAREGGHPLSTSMLGRARATLRAMAVGDDESRDLLRRGRVVGESAATGLEALGALSPARSGGPGQPRKPASTPGAASGREAADRRADREARARDARDREARARAARAQAARDRAALAEARRGARALERDVGKLEAGALRLRRELEAARRRTGELEGRLRDAEARAAEARRRLEEARGVVSRLQGS